MVFVVFVISLFAFINVDVLHVPQIFYIFEIQPKTTEENLHCKKLLRRDTPSRINVRDHGFCFLVASLQSIQDQEF